MKMSKMIPVIVKPSIWTNQIRPVFSYPLPHEDWITQQDDENGQGPLTLTCLGSVGKEGNASWP